MMVRPVVVGVLAVALVGCSGSHGKPVAPAPTTTSRIAHRVLPDERAVYRRVVLGYSVDRRPIVAINIGDPDASQRVLVVGCIHGNETAGIAIAESLIAAAPPPEVDEWVILNLNPDGAAAGTRVSADGVDLNRNFPYRWRTLGPPGSTSYAGPHALSEPESRLAARLLQRVHPTVGIWYHQALAVVDDSQGPMSVEQRYAADVGLPLRPLTDYPGSAVGYEDHLFGPTAFVVELPGGRLDAAQVRRHVHAVLDVMSVARL